MREKNNKNWKVDPNKAEKKQCERKSERDRLEHEKKSRERLE